MFTMHKVFDYFRHCLFKRSENMRNWYHSTNPEEYDGTPLQDGKNVVSLRKSTTHLDSSRQILNSAVARFESKSGGIAAQGNYESHTNSAAHQVLGTYELLENILSFVEFEDLMRAQKVNVAFYHIIGRSKTVRKNFFLESMDPLVLYPAALYSTITHPVTIFDRNPPDVPHPLLQRGGFCAVERPTRRHRVEWYGKILWKDMQRLLYKRGDTWEMMYACQPPRDSMTVDLDQEMFYADGWNDIWQAAIFVDNPDGVRLNEVVNSVVSLLEETEAERSEHIEFWEAEYGSYVRSEFKLQIGSFDGWRMGGPTSSGASGITQ